MKNKFNTATFLRQLALTLLVAMLAAAFQPARAQDSYPEYISEVKVLGCAEGTNINTVSNSYTNQGWTLVDYNLNKGANGDNIYLIYKKASRLSTNGGYITDFIVSDVKNPSSTLTYNGRTYHLCPCDGYNTFTGQQGDLNRGAGGSYVYLYYTTDNFDDKRAVTGISFDATSSNAVQLQCTTGDNAGKIVTADFNRGAQPGDSPHIYMHITTTPKSNRPSNDPVMASGLTFNGSAQTLLSINNTNTGTMMYSVNDGSFSSTIPTATDAGTYTVKYYAASNNYGDQSETKSQTVSIAKANNNKVTTTAALNLTYNGSAQNLITAYSATFGTIQYSLDGTNYSATVPQGKDAKTYTIYYKVEGTSNYNGVSGTATATIKKAANNNATVSIANTIVGRENVNPKVANNLSTGTITYQYSKSSSSDFSTAKPNAPGTWYVKATIDADVNCKEYTTATQNFTLIDWEGDGTSSSPYLIKSTTDLDLLATKVNSGNAYAGTYFKLGADITYLYAGLEENGSNFIAIGKGEHPFYGTFDGQGHSISGIRINTESSYQGLFSKNYGVIKNLTIDNAVITSSKAHVGGIVGINCGTISNCVVTNNVKLTAYNYCGGVVGYNDGTISNCVVNNDVKLTANLLYCGGVTGFNCGSLSDNLVIGATITATSEYKGAIAGDNYEGGKLQNNFYYNTTVNGVNNATGVGCDGADIEDQNGAVSLHTITLGEGISIESPTSPALTSNGIDYYAQGTEITLAYSSTVPEGALLHYTINDGEPTTSNKFTMPAANTTVAAAVEQYYTITLGEGISIESPTSPKLTSNGIDYYAQGTEITLSCTVPEGCALKEYKVNGNAITSNKFIMPAANTTVAAAIEQYYSITLGEGISIESPTSPALTSNGIDYYAQGTEITLAYSSTVPEGALLYYTINDGEPTTSNKFTMPAANTTVAANVEQYYTISLGEGISITSPTSPALTSNGIDYYAQGTEITLSYAVPDGALLYYTINGSAITSNKFTMPAQNTTVAADVEQYYSITLGEGISIESPTSPALTSNGINYYAQGTEISLAYNGNVPDGALLYYTINDGEPTTSNKFTMPAANTNASIIFKPEDYVIDLTSSEPFEIDIDDFEYVFDSWAGNNTAYFDSYVSYPVITHSFDLDLDGTPDAEIVINDYNNSAIVIRLSGANSINKNISFPLDYDATGYKHLVFKFGDDYQTEEAMQLFAIKDNVIYNSGEIIHFVDDLNITTTNVMLQGRTLYRDGRWQTICLPFSVDLTDEDSPLYQAIAYKLQSATIEGNTITADFGSPVTQLEANVPYIIKWNKNLGLEDLKNPIFMDATFELSGNSSTDIPFVGSIDMLPYVGGAIGACRAAFYVGNKPDDENFALYPATGITLNGGDLGISADDIAILTYGEPLSIENVTVLPAAYTGELLSPVLKDGDYTLEKFKDYYIDNVIYNGSHVNEIVEPGVYTVTIIGLGIYSGTTTKQFVVTKDLVIDLGFKISVSARPSAQDAIVLNAWIDNNVAYIYDVDQDNEIVLLNLNFDDTPDVKLEFDENSFEASRGEGANSITTNLRFALDETLVEHFGYGHIVFMFGRSYETVDVIERKIGALNLYEYADRTVAIIDGNYTEADALSITNDINVTSVTLVRDFTEGKYATVVLPFAATPNASDGTFYTFEGVTYDEEKSTWVAGVSSVTSLEPHKPYIFEPKSNLTSLTWNVATTIYTKPTSAATTEVADETYGKWIFKGVYEPEWWAERQTKIYGFAGADKTNRDDQEIHIGDFVRAGYNSSIRPFRCYLEYSGEGGKIDLSTLSKSSLTLPDRIEVRVINSVLEPDDPQENPNGDIETPTSEITPAANLKVWSFDKTIYIAAAPNTPYMIVDMSGRQLQTGITATSRDEIHLPGKVDGIVIVRVANQSFKIRY